jgi:hypothetical protein
MTQSSQMLSKLYGALKHQSKSGTYAFSPMLVVGRCRASVRSLSETYESMDFVARIGFRSLPTDRAVRSVLVVDLDENRVSGLLLNIFFSCA